MTREPGTLAPKELVRRLRLGARAVDLTGEAPILWSGESRQTLVGLLNAAADALEPVGAPVVAHDEANELRAAVNEWAASRRAFEQAAYNHDHTPELRRFEAACEALRHLAGTAGAE